MSPNIPTERTECRATWSLWWKPDTGQRNTSNCRPGSGHEWECDRGYYQLRDRCERLAVPEHAHVSYLGHEWECDRGYYQARDRCEPLVVPEHAHVNYLGHEWECDRGYRQVRDGCVPLSVSAASGRQ